VYCCSCLVCIVVILCVFVVLCVYCCFLTLNAGLLARSQYSEGPATDHLDTGFSWFPCANKQMLRWFPRFQIATTCFSCSPPDLNLVVTISIFYMPPGDNPIAVNKYYYLNFLMACSPDHHGDLVSKLTISILHYNSHGHVYRSESLYSR